MYKLPKLKYKFNELKPVISEEQLKIHYEKHHQGYVNNLNNFIQSQGIDINSFTFNLAGHKLHSLFWRILQKPSENNKPTAKLMKKIKDDFKSFENFKKQFEIIANSTQGSGWACLCLDKETGKLLLQQIEKHQTNLSPDLKVLLVLDVWEHAYYLDYQNRRKDFVSNFWKIINWKEVEKNV
jgi:Fe-Mn family superoxide dismutase